MDKDSGKRPAPHGGLRDAGGADGRRVFWVPMKLTNSRFGGRPWHAATCVRGTDDKEGLLAGRPVPASFNFCQNWLIGCFA